MRCPACDHDNLSGADLCADCGMDLAGLDVSAWGVDPADPVLAMPLGELRLKAPLELPPDATATRAIELLRERREGCVFVTAPTTGELLGVVTERDLCARLAAPARDPDRTRLDEIMTRQPVTLLREDPLSYAMHRMGVDGHRHLPVLDRGRLMGFLSVRTVLRALHQA